MLNARQKCKIVFLPQQPESEEQKEQKMIYSQVDIVTAFSEGQYSVHNVLCITTLIIFLFSFMVFFGGGEVIIGLFSSVWILFSYHEYFP